MDTDTDFGMFEDFSGMKSSTTIKKKDEVNQDADTSDGESQAAIESPVIQKKRLAKRQASDEDDDEQRDTPKESSHKKKAKTVQSDDDSNDEPVDSKRDNKPKGVVPAASIANVISTVFSGGIPHVSNGAKAGKKSHSASDEGESQEEEGDENQEEGEEEGEDDNNAKKQKSKKKEKSNGSKKGEKKKPTKKPKKGKNGVETPNIEIEGEKSKKRGAAKPKTPRFNKEQVKEKASENVIYACMNKAKDVKAGTSKYANFMEFFKKCKNDEEREEELKKYFKDWTIWYHHFFPDTWKKELFATPPYEGPDTFTGKSFINFSRVTYHMFADKIAQLDHHSKKSNTDKFSMDE